MMKRRPLPNELLAEMTTFLGPKTILRLIFSDQNFALQSSFLYFRYRKLIDAGVLVDFKTRNFQTK
jgi:hypothetical protein